MYNTLFETLNTAYAILSILGNILEQDVPVVALKFKLVAVVFVEYEIFKLLENDGD